MSWATVPVIDEFTGPPGALDSGWQTMGVVDGPPTRDGGNMVIPPASFVGAFRTEPWGPDVRLALRATSTFDDGSPYAALWLRASGLGTSSRSGYRVTLTPADPPFPPRIRLQRVDDEDIVDLGEPLMDFIESTTPPLTLDAHIAGQIVGTLLQAWAAPIPGDDQTFQKLIQYDTADDAIKYEDAGQVGLEMFSASGWLWTSFRAETELEGLTGEPIPATPSFMRATGEGWQNRPAWRATSEGWIPLED